MAAILENTSHPTGLFCVEIMSKIQDFPEISIDTCCQAGARDTFPWQKKEQRTDAVYSIPCNDCDNEYIGQTKRQFGTRLKEHQKAVFLCKKENSALSEHTCLTNHTIGWDNSKIITTNLRYHQRLCFEALHTNSAHAPLIYFIIFG